MKSLGLIAGPPSCGLDIYWKTIALEATKSFGAGHFPECVVHCLDTARIAEQLREEDWTSVADSVTDAGKTLALSGVDCLVLCGSALNVVAPEVRRSLEMPIIDLGYAMATKVRSLSYRKVGLLGARSKEEVAMWKEKLDGISVFTPTGDDSQLLGRWVDAAAHGQPVQIEWKIQTNRIVSYLKNSGAQAIILAAPALNHWVKPGDVIRYPICAAEIHAWVASLWAMEARNLPTPPCVLA